MRRRTYEEYVTPKPKPRGIDVVTTLRHFALVTYTINPDALRRRLPPRLSPLTIDVDGARRALLSVVLFMNTNFRSAVFPSPSFNMAQINYRAYVIDEHTGDHAIWFLGTLLDGWAFLVPRVLWRMPWRKGSIQIRYRTDPQSGLYESYVVTSTSRWAPATAEIVQKPTDDPEEGDGPPTLPPIELPGFPDVETGLVCLTHATKGFFRRSDGKIGLNRVWHDRIPVGPAHLTRADFPLLGRWQLVSTAEQARPYSVLLAPEIGFMSMLPPQVVTD